MQASKLEQAATIITPDNARFFVEEIKDKGTDYTGGYEAGSVDRRETLRFASEYSGTVIRRTEWDNHLKRQEAEKSSPEDWAVAGGCKILNQGRWGYCWMYGLVGAVQVAIAQTGLCPVPRLSAMAPAYQGKKGRNQGGWAGEALKYVRTFGVPTDELWPNRQADPQGRLARDPAVKASADRLKNVAFEELPRNSFDHLFSTLIDPQNPRPVTLGLNWWGHLVHATKAVKLGANEYGVLIRNSWGETWEGNGMAYLSERKATAYEQIAVSDGQPRTAE